MVLYTWDLQNVKNISGAQIGAYFGYSLASGDIDGDGYEDLVVGAPMYTRAKTDGYEHGKIYVFYQGSNTHSVSWIILVNVFRHFEILYFLPWVTIGSSSVSNNRLNECFASLSELDGSIPWGDMYL